MARPSLLVALCLLAMYAAANCHAETVCSKTVPGQSKITAQMVSAPRKPPGLSCGSPPGVPNLSDEKTIIFNVLFGCLGFLPNPGSRIISLTFLEVMTAYMQAGLGASEAYSPVSEAVTPIVPTKVPRRPVSEHTPQNRNTAVFYAIYRVLERYQASVPDMFDFVAGQLKATKLDAANNCVAPLTNPICVGNLVAKAVIDHFGTLGWNRDGSTGRTFNGHPYEDYSGFAFKNTAYKLDIINQWQPLMETDGQGFFWAQGPLAPWAGANVKHLVINNTEFAARTLPDPLPKKDCTSYQKQVDEMLALNAKLGTNDTMKMIAEMVNGPPYAFRTMAYLTLAVNPTYWNTHRMFAYLAGFWAAIHDGQVLAFKEKYKWQAVRPQSAIRYLYGNSKVLAYAGPGKGTQEIAGNEWTSYVRTANEPEYPSGSVCWVTVWSEWLQYWLKLSMGTTDVNIPFSFGKHCSDQEPGVSPASDVSFTVNFKSTQPMIDLAKLGRMASGVHFQTASDAGQALCSGLAKMTWEKMKPTS